MLILTQSWQFCVCLGFCSLLCSSLALFPRSFPVLALYRFSLEMSLKNLLLLFSSLLFTSIIICSLFLCFGLFLVFPHFSEMASLWFIQTENLSVYHHPIARGELRGDVSNLFESSYSHCSSSPSSSSPSSSSSSSTSAPLPLTSESLPSRTVVLKAYPPVTSSIRQEVIGIWTRFRVPDVQKAIGPGFKLVHAFSSSFLLISDDFGLPLTPADVRNHNTQTSIIRCIDGMIGTGFANIDLRMSNFAKKPDEDEVHVVDVDRLEWEHLEVMSHERDHFSFPPEAVCGETILPYEIVGWQLLLLGAQAKYGLVTKTSDEWFDAMCEAIDQEKKEQERREEEEQTDVEKEEQESSMRKSKKRKVAESGTTPQQSGKKRQRAAQSESEQGGIAQKWQEVVGARFDYEKARAEICYLFRVLASSPPVS